jgi:hypothetical protein
VTIIINVYDFDVGFLASLGLIKKEKKKVLLKELSFLTLYKKYIQLMNFILLPLKNN